MSSAERKRGWHGQYLASDDEGERKYFVAEWVSWPLQVLIFLNAFLVHWFGWGFWQVGPKTFNVLKSHTPPNVHEAFGPQENFERGLSLFSRAIAKNPYINGLGHLGIRAYTECVLIPRYQCMEYVSAHPEVLQQEIKCPVIITGLNRSGTTLLFNLLYQDERTRSPFFYEMYGTWDHNPTVVTSRSQHLTDPRAEELGKLLTTGGKLMPESTEMQNKCHHVHKHSIEEDYIICAHQMQWMAQVPLCWDNGECESFFYESDKAFVFRYLRVYLQMLQSGYAPQSHWLLKTPTHMLHLDCLFEEFPDCRLIICHRDPAEAIPSMCYLIESIYRSYWEHNTFDLRVLGGFVHRMYVLMTTRMMAFRNSHPKLEEQFLDIQFKKFTADPLAEVERVYAHYHLHLTDQAKEKMRGYLSENGKHKYGKPDATLDRYGLSREKIEADFCEYKSRFL